MAGQGYYTVFAITSLSVKPVTILRTAGLVHEVITFIKVYIHEQLMGR